MGEEIPKGKFQLSWGKPSHLIDLNDVAVLDGISSLDCESHGTSYAWGDGSDKISMSFEIPFTPQNTKCFKRLWNFHKPHIPRKVKKKFKTRYAKHFGIPVKKLKLSYGRRYQDLSIVKENDLDLLKTFMGYGKTE